VLLALLLASFLAQDSSSTLAPPPSTGVAPLRTVAIDEVLASKANLKVGDTISLSAKPGEIGDAVVVAAIVRRGADPSEVSRGDMRVRLHLDQLQQISSYGDRVDRFAVGTAPGADIPAVVDRINRVAFGFRAYPSRDIAVETSRTFQVVSRFHRAIGIITIVASSVFLLCIMVLKVEERRRDIAALRLMGISQSTVVRSIVIESALVAVLGSGLGIVLGWLVSLFVNWHYQALYQTPLEFSVLTPSIVTAAVALSLALGIGAGVLASLRLARTPPLQLFGR
jgi:putative ABC transport system permease protein